MNDKGKLYSVGGLDEQSVPMGRVPATLSSGTSHPSPGLERTKAEYATP